MEIFIGWSGKKSKKIATEIRIWLPNMIQSVVPFMSEEDIEKGTNWDSEISKQLEKTNFGIVVLTKTNHDTPWINFEAGALSKDIGKSKVWGILFDVIKNDIRGPLSRFQLTSNNKEDIFKLIKSINISNTENTLDSERLKLTFETWWPKLEEKINTIMEGEEEVETDIESTKTDDDLSDLSNPKLISILDDILYYSKQQNELLANITKRNEVSKVHQISSAQPLEHIQPKVKNGNIANIMPDIQVYEVKVRGNIDKILTIVQKLKMYPGILEIEAKKISDEKSEFVIIKAYMKGNDRSVKKSIRGLLHESKLTIENISY